MNTQKIVDNILGKKKKKVKQIDYAKIRAKNAIALRLEKEKLEKSLIRESLTEGISSEYMTEIPEKIKTKLAIGIPLDEDEMKFIPKLIRMKKFDESVKYIQENINDSNCQINNLKEIIKKLESERKEMFFKKKFDRVNGCQIMIDEYKESIKYTKEIIRDAEKRIEIFRERFNL